MKVIKQLLIKYIHCVLSKMWVCMSGLVAVNVKFSLNFALSYNFPSLLLVEVFPPPKSSGLTF